MEPEPDVITNGRVQRPRAHDGDANAPAHPTGPVSWRTARLRWVGPVAAVLLLAVAVFVATLPNGGPEPVAAPSPTTKTLKAPPSLVMGPTPTPDNRPETSAPSPLFKDAVRALGPAGEGRIVSAVELLGSDYRRGEASLGVFEELTQGPVTVDLVCVGTGTTRVWIQDQSGRSGAGSPSSLDCAHPSPVRLSTTISGAGYYVYANPDPQTVAVLAYVPSGGIAVERTQGL
jgi:hypothetical protein